MLVSGVQMDVQLGQIVFNQRAIIQRFREARQRGAELVVYPECALTGYCFESLDEARPHAQSIPGPATESVAAACRELGGVAIFGMLEHSSDGGVYNSAAVVNGNGLVARYRKVHLPFLGVDRFSTFGDEPFSVHQLGNARVGVNICYDAGFPEAARCLTLLGADVIALPTNWPPGAKCFSAYSINARAMENAVYYLAVNRVGVERGVEFIGSSRFCDPQGQTIAQGDEKNEQMLYAEIDLAAARQKHIVRIPGQHEIDRIADRRPDFYQQLTVPHELKRPGRK